MPEVSVIIPTYKRPAYLIRAVDSVLNQTYLHIKILIIDDNGRGSQQQIETEELVRKTYRSNPKVCYYSLRKNKGGSHARNVGIRLASSQYIAFLDDDDEYLPSKIERQMDKILSSSLSPSFVYCGMTIKDSEGKTIKHKRVYASGTRDAMIAHLKYFLTGTPAILAKRDALIKVGSFSRIAALQDSLLIFKLLNNNNAVDYCIEELIVAYEHKSERVTKGIKKIEAISNYVNIVMSDYSFPKDDMYYVALTRIRILLAREILNSSFNNIINYLPKVLVEICCHPKAFIDTVIEIMRRNLSSYK